MFKRNRKLRAVSIKDDDGLRRAQGLLKKAKEDQPIVDELTASLRQHRIENHFGESLAKAMRGKHA